MAPALRRGFLLPFDDICNIGELVINISPSADICFSVMITQVFQ